MQVRGPVRAATVDEVVNRWLSSYHHHLSKQVWAWLLVGYRYHTGGLHLSFPSTYIYCAPLSLRRPMTMLIQIEHDISLASCKDFKAIKKQQRER